MYADTTMGVIKIHYTLSEPSLQRIARWSARTRIFSSDLAQPRSAI
jgi:hypothetical protein